MAKDIIIKGARVNNLKNIDLTIPRDKLTVLTGLSGSGKSSLAFDTLYAEGHRRFVESLSSYARQFLGQMDKPDVDSIEGLSPAIAIDQKTTSKNPRSTVGTVTEIYDYLRLLYARCGVPHCPVCGREIKQQTVDSIIDSILAMPEGTRFMVLAPIVRNAKGTHEKVLADARRSGYARVRVDGSLYDLTETISLDKNLKHTVEIVVDRLVCRPDAHTRIGDSVETAVALTDGLVRIVTVPREGEGMEEERDYSLKYACEEHGISFGELEPRMFSFNAPDGACPRCAGLGALTRVSEKKLMPDKSLSLREGGIACNGFKSLEEESWNGPLIEAVGRKFGFTMDLPLEKYTRTAMSALLYGTGKETYTVTRYFGGTAHHQTTTFEGIIPMIDRRRESYGQEYYDSLLEEQVCPECGGGRLNKMMLAVTVGGKNIYELCLMPIDKMLDFITKLELDNEHRQIAAEIVKEIRARLGFLVSVGLEYLNLARRAGTLSGGEAQRIRLATQIGSSLVGVLYILDEPSIGLHQRDNDKLIATLNRAVTFPGEHDSIEGVGALDKVIAIDQSPIGRTPRSNPATYTGVFSEIRELFAKTREAKARGYKAGRFSFNTKGGRCEACEGDGVKCIEMHFLPDVYVKCDVCGGRRYNRETLEVHYKEKNIYEVLEMTVEEGIEFFSGVPSVKRKLQTLYDVGLGYVKIGQSSTTLSGGEAQRVKLATELARRSTGRTVYILDEPTTGLHSEDVAKLITVLNRLVDAGNTVIVIEHNLDMIKVADHIIDLGPEGGEGGGRIVAAGTPEEVAEVEGSYTGQYLRRKLAEK